MDRSLTNEFSAADSSLGYLFQVRYALWLLLKAEASAEMSLELLDDIAFHNQGTASELLQAKHTLSTTASLTDAS
ncbi:MAG: hypothetical protein EOP06_30335, partial [Proteobacteria bacterium]